MIVEAIIGILIAKSIEDYKNRDLREIRSKVGKIMLCEDPELFINNLGEYVDINGVYRTIFGYSVLLNYPPGVDVKKIKHLCLYLKDELGCMDVKFEEKFKPKVAKIDIIYELMDRRTRDELEKSLCKKDKKKKYKKRKIKEIKNNVERVK